MGVTLDGLDLTGCTIDGEEVKSITIDGNTVWTAVPINLYISDGYDIYKIDPDGNVLWEFADGYNKYRDIVVDIEGNFYLADADNGRIVKMNSEGSVLWYDINLTDGNFTGIDYCPKNDYIYASTDIGEVYQFRIVKTTNWLGQTTYSLSKEMTFFGDDSNEEFSTVRVDSNGDFWTAIFTGSELTKIAPNGDVIDIITSYEVYENQDIAIDSDGSSVYTAGENGTYRWVAHNNTSDEYFDNKDSFAVAVDKSYIYVAGTNEVRKYEQSNGNLLWSYSVSGSVLDITVDSQGFVYFTSDNIVYKLNSNGNKIWDIVFEFDSTDPILIITTQEPVIGTYPQVWQ